MVTFGSLEARSSVDVGTGDEDIGNTGEQSAANTIPQNNPTRSWVQRPSVSSDITMVDWLRRKDTSLVSAPSGQVTTTTQGDGVPNRLVNLYRGRGVPRIWKEGGGVGSVSKPQKAPDLRSDLADI